ncbi:MAG: type II secretion system protein N [Sphingorhabdus sp.]
MMVSRRTMILVLGVVALLSLLLLLPMGMAANMLGVSARNSQGTIVSGALRDASIGRAAIGDVNVRLQPLQLLLGRLAFRLSRGDAPYAPGVSGVVGSGLGGYFANELTTTIDSRALAAGFDGGDLRLETLSLRFANGRCVSASGIVRLNLDHTVLGAATKGGLMGNAACRNGELVVPLLSESTMERLTLRVKGDGRYTATLTLSEPPADLATGLTLAGFKPVAGGYRLVRSGRLN